ncbi:helix-turn-helix domain-containing protein [uncultured Brachyspira sp.]|uniref:helix-turn-helix domain-containing protein n=1 Tax=uncultured Brachyspira sp. TaxID=221953 RepID=UPI0025ED92BE|nr:helix-turn-helix domain-containing protein [uncultured Brachyspira sp.]
MIDFNLKDIREKILKLTQSQFAKMLGVRQDYISRLERNANNITLDLLDKLAENTGLTIDELTKYKKNSFENETPYLYENLINIQAVTDKINEEINTIDKKNSEKIIEIASDIYNKINETFNIIVYGRYSSGKTSFINAIFDKNIDTNPYTEEASNDEYYLQDDSDLFRIIEYKENILNTRKYNNQNMFIYMCDINAFSQEDITNINALSNFIDDFNNIFIIFSKANIFDENELESVINKKFNILQNFIESSCNIKKIDYSHLRKRFFPFSINNTNLVKDIKEDFAQNIKYAYYSRILTNINFITEIINSKNEFQENDKLDININKIKIAAKEQFNEIYINTLNIDNIIKAIDDNNVYRKKDDIKVLCNSINLKLDTQVYNMLAITKDDFNNKDNNKIKSNIVNVSLGIIPKFNLLKNSGMKIINLIGVSLSFLPSVVFILSGFMSFSGNWKKTLSKKVIKAYEEENTVSKYNKTIDEYFNNYLANIKDINIKTEKTLKYYQDAKFYKNIKTILNNFYNFIENERNKI